MLTDQFIDIIQRTVSGDIVTADNKYDDAYVLQLIDGARAVWLVQMYAIDKRIAPICYQKYYPEFSLPLQPTDRCFAKFKMPDIVKLDSNSDGIRYAGSDDYEGGEANNFRRIVSRAWLSTFYKHPIMNPASRFYSTMYDASNQTLEFRGKARFIKKPLIEAVFKHPTDIPTFNRDADDYPLSMDGITAVQHMIFQNDTRIVESTKPTPAFGQPAQLLKK